MLLPAVCIGISFIVWTWYLLTILELRTKPLRNEIDSQREASAYHWKQINIQRERIDSLTKQLTHINHRVSSLLAREKRNEQKVIPQKQHISSSCPSIKAQLDAIKN